VHEAAAGVLFSGGGLAARPLRREEIPRLQAFYAANPEYFLAINGKAPPADLAAIEFDEVPPPHLSFARQYCLGLFAAGDGDVGDGDASDGDVGDSAASGGEAGALEGVALVTVDLCAQGVWHLGLFIIATRLHGHGVAAPVYAALEDWVRRGGARYLRLGVVVGNERGERFWRRQGFVRISQKEGIDTGGRLNTVQRMLKPLADDSIEAYLQAVPRDRPGSTLP
jgi:GNAT superfamily N-acetyltransferase